MNRENSQTSDFTYSGTDNLEAMAAAENYNAFLVRTLAKHLRGRRAILDFGAGIGYFAGKMRALGFSMEFAKAALDSRPKARGGSGMIRCLYPWVLPKHFLNWATIPRTGLVTGHSH